MIKNIGKKSDDFLEKELEPTFTEGNNGYLLRKGGIWFNKK